MKKVLLMLTCLGLSFSTVAKDKFGNNTTEDYLKEGYKVVAVTEASSGSNLTIALQKKDSLILCLVNDDGSPRRCSHVK